MQGNLSRKIFQRNMLFLFCLVLIFSPFSSLGESVHAGNGGELQALEDLIEEAEQLDEDDYVEGSYQNFEATLDEARDVVANPDASENEINAALVKLQKAMGGLLPKTIDITVEKVWADPNPDVRMVGVYLLENGERFINEPSFNLTAGGNWAYTIKNAPIVDINGNPIEYSVEEEPIEGYESTVTGSAEDGFTITNTKIATDDPNMFDLTVEKVWEGPKAGPVNFHIFANGEKLEGEQAELYFQLREANDWTFTMKAPLKDDGGKPIEYRVEEVPVEGYESEVTGSAEDGFTITNTKIATDDPETIDLTVDKVWEGQEQDFITFYLLKNGERAGYPVTIYGEKYRWSYTFEGLELKDDGGKPIEYSVEEVPIDGYESEVTGSAEEGFTITNTEITEPDPETIFITVEKVWEGQEQDSITFHLLANGVKMGDPVTINKEDDDWIYIFEGLPLKEDGDFIDYSIEEEPIEGYETEITGSAEEVFTITNTEITEEDPKEDPKDPEEDPEGDDPEGEDDEDNGEDSTEVTVDEKDDETPKKTAAGKELPKTATSHFTLLAIGLIIIIAGGTTFIVGRRLRKN